MRRQYDGLLALLVHYGCSQRGTVTCDRLGPVVLAQYGINPHANSLFAIGAATLLMNRRIASDSPRRNGLEGFDRPSSALQA
jgi:hypothetical protein